MFVCLSVNSVALTTAADRTSTVTPELLLHSDGSVVSGTLTIGVQYRIRVTYTPPAGTTAGEWPVGIFNYQLDVSPDFLAQTPTTKPMIDGSG